MKFRLLRSRATTCNRERSSVVSLVLCPSVVSEDDDASPIEIHGSSIDKSLLVVAVL